MHKTLTTSVAAIALMTGTAFAQSESDAGGTLTTEQSAEAEIQDTSEELEQSSEQTGEAVEDAAEGTAQATENTAEDAAEGAENMAADTEAGASDGNAVTSTQGGMSSSFDGMLVGDILGMNVTTQSGEDVGEIDYVVRQGESLAAVIGIGGFLGLGEYTVAVPLEEFSMAAEDEGMTLSSWTEKELKAQPEFDETGVEGLEDDVPLDSAM